MARSRVTRVSCTPAYTYIWCEWIEPNGAVWGVSVYHIQQPSEALTGQGPHAPHLEHMDVRVPAADQHQVLTHWHVEPADMYMPRCPVWVGVDK